MNGSPRTKGSRPWQIGAVLAAIALIGALILFVAQPWAQPPAADTGPRAEKAGVTLLELKKTAQLRAATGTYSVPVQVDAQQQTTLNRYVPDLLDGEKIVAIYQGSVDALIDLNGLTDQDLTANTETRTLIVKVSEPTLTRPNIDHDESQIVSHTRGLLVRTNDALRDVPADNRRLLDQAASEAIAAAAEQSSLRANAEESGRTFLTAVGHRFGYDSVTVTYQKPRG